MLSEPIRFKKLLGKIKVQLFIFSILLVYYFLNRLRVIPSLDDFLVFLTRELKNNYYLVSVCSFLENIVGLSVYFPGSIVILTTMALTHGNIPSAIVTFLCIYIFSIFAQITNFYLGSRLKRNQNSSIKSYWILFWTTMWHPQFAAVTSLRVGNAGIKFKNFLKFYLPTSFIWNLFWGTLMYNIGTFSSSPLLFDYIFIAYLGLWTLYDIKIFFKEENNFSKS